MDTLSPDQLDARSFIERFQRGEFPDDFVLVAARGFLPLSQEDLVVILAFLAATDNEEVAETARASLAEVPTRSIVNVARNQDTDPDLLDRIARATEDPLVLEAIVRNRSTSDDTFRELAPRAGTHIQEIIIVNHERLIRAPDIVDALETNPNLSNDVRRRITEVREEFFGKKRIEEVKIEEGWEYELTPEEKEQYADLLEAAETSTEDPKATLPATAAPTEGDGKEGESIWVRVQSMTISQRVQCALKGGRTERSILVKDRNKLVCGAVVKSPRITESEVESFAAMRNVEEEVLRVIGGRREWMQKYPIMSALVRNPKAPIGVVLPLVNRLTLKDLKSLSGDKGVSEAVRQTARRLYGQRKKT
ncbi:MAG: hypothetical protein ACRD2J_13165 [Thermoanaerobaculia bacterium]